MPSGQNSGTQRYVTDHPPARTVLPSHNSTRRDDTNVRRESMRRAEPPHYGESTDRRDTTTRAESTRRGESTARHESTRQGETTARTGSTKRGESTYHADSTRRDRDSTHHADSTRREDTGRTAPSRHDDSSRRPDESALTRSSIRRDRTDRTVRAPPTQTLAPGMTDRLQRARQELVAREHGREPTHLDPRTVQRREPMPMPAYYGPQYGPDPHGGDTLVGNLEAVGMAAMGIGKGIQEVIAAYNQGGLPAAGVVAARALVGTKQKIDARFPNGVR